jgi:hypothetical protein
VAVPVYLLLKAARKMSTVRVLVVFGLGGVLASQFVHLAQAFQQPGCREFANSWLSPLFGCLCGLASGACFALTVNRRFSPAALVLGYSLPSAIIIACGSALVWSAKS